MEGMTATVRDLLRDHATETARLHVVVHSMGGAIGVPLAEQTPIPLASFINVEGNLVGADCGMLSRRTAEMDPTQFRDEKFARLKARARDADDPIIWAYTKGPIDGRVQRQDRAPSLDRPTRRNRRRDKGSVVSTSGLSDDVSGSKFSVLTVVGIGPQPRGSRPLHQQQTYGCCPKKSPTGAVLGR